MANRQRDQRRPLCPWLSPGLSLGLDQPVFHLAGFTKAGCRFQLYEDLNAAWNLKAQEGRTEHISVHSPIYKEPDEDGAAGGLGTYIPSRSCETS